MALQGLSEHCKPGEYAAPALEFGFTVKAPKTPVKQLGFTVRDASILARHLSPPTIKEASPAEENGEEETWALPSHWKQGFTPFQLASSVIPGSQPMSSGFKGFKDFCEAGSFSLGGSQVLQENGRLEVVGTTHASAGIRSLVKSVVGGLRACQQPEPSAEGLGGTYFFLDESGEKKAIVKPCDEEPLAPNNPKGFVGRALGEPGLKPTVRVGEAAMREVAAFLLDYEHFARVPYTVLVRVTHNVFHVASEQPSFPDHSPDSAMSCSQASASSFFQADLPALAVPPPSPLLPSKLASLQEFMQHQGDASEMGSSRFCVSDVHRIGILDLRLFNTDRHAGNMLVRCPPASIASRWPCQQPELIPIDHGFCLPEALEPPYLEWLHWPQAMVPFGEEELAYISRLDAAADVEFLQKELPWLPEGSLRTLQVATLLLTKCAAAGLTLAEIGTVASRPLVGLDEEASQLETVCLAARAAVDDGEVSEGAISEDEGEDSGGGTLLSAVGCPLKEASLKHESSDASMVMGMQVPLETMLSGDELLFDLEEDAGLQPIDRRIRSLSTLGSSESGAQTKRSLRSIASDAGTTSSRGSGTMENASSMVATQPGMARSLATGMLHHHAARAHNSQFRNNTRSPKLTPKRRNRAAYPPPVVGMHHSGMNSVFEGLDNRGWRLFMEAVEDLIQEALDHGSWKKSADRMGTGKPAFGMSCPRF